MEFGHDAGKIIEKAERLFNTVERHAADIEWNALSKNIIPNQSGVFVTTTTTPGIRRTRGMYDATAVQANQDLSAAIHSTVTNPAAQWFNVAFKDEELNNDSEALAWLESVKADMLSAINESNFDVQIAKNYQSFTALGTMVLMHEEKEKEEGQFAGFRFTAWHLSQLALEEDENGDVDTVYRKFKLTANQAFKRWEGKVSKDIIEALETNPHQEFEFLHCIAPRDKKQVKLGDGGLAPPNKRPYMSVYVDVDNHKIMETGGS